MNQINKPEPISPNAILRRSLSDLARHIKRGEWVLLTHDGDVYTCESMPVLNEQGLYQEPTGRYLLSIQGDVPVLYHETIWKV